MKALIIEQPEWSSQKEITEALKNNAQILLRFHGFDLLIPALATLKPDVLAIDACLGPQRQTNTAPLIAEIKKVFKGELIAISNTVPARTPLKIAGCRYECAKGRLPELLIKIAGQQA
jgi:hypothetical protein